MKRSAAVVRILISLRARATFNSDIWFCALNITLELDSWYFMVHIWLVRAAKVSLEHSKLSTQLKKKKYFLLAINCVWQCPGRRLPFVIEFEEIDPEMYPEDLVWIGCHWTAVTTHSTHTTSILDEFISQIFRPNEFVNKPIVNARTNWRIHYAHSREQEAVRNKVPICAL